MAKIKLDARTVASLSVELGRQDFFDLSLPCFGIRVTSGRRKTWFVAYRINGRKRRFTLGTFPAVALSDARDRAKALLAEVAKGADPMERKLEARDADTIQDLIEMYLESAKIKKVSWRDDKYKLETYLAPRFGKLKAGLLKKSDVMGILDSVSTKGYKVEPNRILRVIRRMYNWGIERELVTSNPCYKIKNPVREHARARVLTPEEIKRFWDALDSEIVDVWTGTKKDKIKVTAILKLILLTDQRGGEVKKMEWSEIDLSNGVWTIPKEKIKTRNDHRVPLNDQALHILRELKLITGQGRYVFPSPYVVDTHIDNIQKAIERVRVTAGLANFSAHDLRRTAASHMASMSVPRLVIKKILGHVCSDITGVYDQHSYDFEKSRALKIWGDRVAAILNGQTDFSADSEKTVWLRLAR